MTLSVVNPESGTATEELGATYSAARDRDRLQRALSARHHRPDRRQGRALPAFRCRLAHPHRGHRGQAHALCPHADAGLSLTTLPAPCSAPTARRPPLSGARALAVTRLRCAISAPTRRPSSQSSGAPVVLAGANGAGKTNLLDAISLLSPGRGLARRQACGDHMRKAPAESRRATHCGRWRRRVARDGEIRNRHRA